MEPLVRARDTFPASMAPRNALAAARSAEDRGWSHRLTLAVGWPDDATEEPVRSVMLTVRRDGEYAMGVWENGGWRFGYADKRQISYSEFVHLIKGTTPAPTVKAQADAETDRQNLRAAIENVMDAGGVVDRMIPAGTADRWCKGHVQLGWPLGRQRCVNPSGQDYLCAGPCRHV